MCATNHPVCNKSSKIIFRHMCVCRFQAFFRGSEEPPGSDDAFFSWFRGTPRLAQKWQRRQGSSTCRLRRNPRELRDLIVLGSDRCQVIWTRRLARQRCGQAQVSSLSGQSYGEAPAAQACIMPCCTSMVPQMLQGSKPCR